MPDFLEYHKSLTDELHSLKDRIRNLTEHWPTDGEYKEAALRTVLRRHLPSSLVVGRGFIVTEQSGSTQIDLLIADGNKPTLFRDGELMFVTPDCVRAVIEVKTSLPAAANVEECAVKLAKIGKQCRMNGEAMPWLGIFSYEGTLRQDAPLLNAVEAAYDQTEAVINCLAYGKDRFVRFWKKGELERGDAPDTANVERWRAYRLEDLASAYFVGNVVDALSTLSRKNNAFAWYPLSDGKRVHMRAERKLNRR
jgi:hypothetical protein